MKVMATVAGMITSTTALAGSLTCPAGSQKMVECTTSTFSAAYCETAHNGSAVVVSNAPGFARAQVGPKRGILHSKTATLNSKIVIVLRHTDNTGPGEISMANETRPAYCEVRRGYQSTDQIPMP